MSIQTDAKRFNKTSLDSGHPVNIINIENDDEYYKKGYGKAGIAVIFTQQEFPNDSSLFRHGADVDKRNLIRILTSYGYEVRDYLDRTTEQIENVLKDVAREDHSNNSSLIVVMMSHGGKDEYTNEGIIYTHDGKLKVDSLWRYFTGDRCLSLVGKPKLFFIQACRGAVSDIGAVLEEDERRFNQNDDESARRSQIAPVARRIPAMADILVMFSSADDHVSYRDTESGSWFIEALCKQLEKYLNAVDEKDLMSILTSVNRYVAFSREYVDNNYWRLKQMPVIMSMLTKTFKFDKNLLK